MREGAQPRAREARARRERKGPWWLVGRVLVFAAFIGAWALFATTHLAKISDLPSPFDSVKALIDLAQTGEFWQTIGVTVSAWGAGLALSVVIGIAIGLPLGTSRWAYLSTRVPIDALRSLPPIAIVPLVLLIMGAKLQTVIVMVVISAVWPIIVQSIYGVQNRDPELARVARSYRLSLRYRLGYVIAPELLVFLWPAFRLAATLSLLVTVTTELITGAPGIGSAIRSATTSVRTEDMFAYVIVAGVLGVTINLVLAGVQAKAFGWSNQVRGAK